MKKIYWILMVFALLLTACHPNRVKIRGTVKDLKGTVKLLAELPGQQGLVVLDQQEVTDGNIELTTDSLIIPARVWVDIAGKRTLEFIVDTKDQIGIVGKAKFPDQIAVKGSGIEEEYAKVKKLFKEKYEEPLEPIDKKIQKILSKEKMSKEEEVLLGVYQLRRLRYIRARANYSKTLVEANPDSDLSLFLIKDELRDSTDLQKRLFNSLKVPNQESNVYKNLALELQNK